MDVSIGLARSSSSVFLLDAARWWTLGVSHAWARSRILGVYNRTGLANVHWVSPLHVARLFIMGGSFFLARYVASVVYTHGSLDLSGCLGTRGSLCVFGFLTGSGSLGLPGFLSYCGTLTYPWLSALLRLAHSTWIPNRAWLTTGPRVSYMIWCALVPWMSLGVRLRSSYLGV